MAIHDPVRDRLVVDGRWPECVGETWALSLSGSPAWTEIWPGQGFTRAWHAGIYDPPRDRLIVFGWSDCYPFGYFNGTKALALSGAPSWSNLTPAGTLPAGRVRHTTIYDPVRDRMIAFGGDLWGSGSVNQTWELTLAGTPTWTLLSPAGTPPSARSHHTAIYDPVRDRMLVFGGNAASGRVNDVWELTLSGTATWSVLAPTGNAPDGRSQHSAIYDPVRDRMVVFGGYDPGGQQMNDVWALELAGTPAWTALAPDGTLPLARGGHEAIYDPVRDRMVVYGGQNPPEDLWALQWGVPVGIGPPRSGSGPLSLEARPNLAASDVAIEFVLPRPGHASLRLYDTRGRLIRVLFEGDAPATGSRLIWDGLDEWGRSPGPGVFFLRLRFEGIQLTQRLVVIS